MTSSSLATSDELTINIETLMALLDTVYEHGETQGYMTGFYEADEEPYDYVKHMRCRVGN